MTLEHAILETLAYSDVFDFPLTIDEIHRYLVLPASRDQVSQAVRNMNMVETCEGYYFLTGRQAIVDLRKAREAASYRVFRRAEFYGRILCVLPFVRMVAVTGSLAVRNLVQAGDIDYMLVTQPGRLWSARLFAVAFGRMMRLFGDTICVNVLITESALNWSTHDLYSAREMCQMAPLADFNVYQKLRVANSWTQSFLPNAMVSIPTDKMESQYMMKRIQTLMETPLLGKPGDRLERQLQRFQMQHIARRFGKGNEANFSADLCQGNFHDHHHQTDALFRERLTSLGLIQQVEEFAVEVAA